MTTKKITTELANAVGLYLKLVPLEKQAEIKSVLSKPPKKTYENYWSSIDLPYPDLKEKDLEELFIEIAVLRNNLAVAQGYKDFTDMSTQRYKVSSPQIAQFKRDSAYLAQRINTQLNIESIEPFENKCLTCEMNEFPFKTKDDVKKFFIKKFDYLEKRIEVIEISNGEYSRIFYDKRVSEIKIELDGSVNDRHQLKDLFHEMCHAVMILNRANDGYKKLSSNKYKDEKEVFETELKFYKKISSEFYDSLLFDILLTFRDVIFELNLYEKPNQDLNKLYAQTHNTIFYKSNQIKNPLYLFNKDILLRPLYSMPHAISRYEVLNHSYHT